MYKKIVFLEKFLEIYQHTKIYLVDSAMAKKVLTVQLLQTLSCIFCLHGVHNKNTVNINVKFNYLGAPELL